jgi:predicted TIM-barrel enzyme
MTFFELFTVKKPILAMVHLKGNDREEKLERAKKEIDIYYDNGIDAVIVEDYFGSKHDVEKVLEYLHQNLPGKTYGVNVLDNFHRSYELAALYGGKFLQVDSSAGHLPECLDKPYGQMIDAYRVASNVLVLGGVRSKYQPLLSGRSLEEDLAIGMCLSDAVVVTGEGTGLDTDNAKIIEFRRIIDDFPLIVGAGVTVENAAEKLAVADAAIVGSCFKDTGKDNGDVSPEKVRAFMQTIYPLREQ